MKGGNKKKRLGAWGEQQSVLFLQKEGYSILEKNFQTRRGEIDIIAWHTKRGQKTLCFIEVKTRNGQVGSAERATGRQKILRLKRTAQEYCIIKGINIEDTPIQFEHIGVYVDFYDKSPIIRHYIIPVE